MYELIANKTIANRLIEENENSSAVIITYSGDGIKYNVVGTMSQLVDEQHCLMLDIDTGDDVAEMSINLNTVIKCEYINKEYFDIYLQNNGKINIYFLK